MTAMTHYQLHLESVSRTFALCIPQLSPPFREQVALAYLLLRILDTVEDAPFTDRALQARQFAAFRHFLREPPDAGQLQRFRGAFPAGVPEGERALLDDAQRLLSDAHALPLTARAVIFDGIDRMAEGMALYAGRLQPMRLLDVEDVVRYCCVVAGLVGELLTRLWSNGRAAPPLLHAYRFGLFLQKVNILKDEAEDEAAGRFFVPDRRAILATLRADAAGAMAYLTALPREERGYRIFCAWSLMLGAASVAAQQEGAQGSRRSQTLALLERVAEMAQDDAALRRQFAELLPELPETRRGPAVPKPAGETGVLRRLFAPLSLHELEELGAIAAPQYGYPSST